MLWDPFLYCINDSIQGNSETGNKVFVLPSKVDINSLGFGFALGTIPSISPKPPLYARFPERGGFSFFVSPYGIGQAIGSVTYKPSFFVPA